MSTAKLGVIFIVTAMALAGLGAGYAAWFDTITVEGTVSTGSVKLDIEAYSGTDVYKVYGPDIAPNDEIRFFRGYDFERPDPTDLAAVRTYFGLAESTTIELIASAWSHDYTGDGTFDFGMTYDNLFPSIDFTADFILHYEGTIPVKVNVADLIMYTDWLAELYAAGGVSIKAYRCTVTDANQPLGPENYPTETTEVVDLGTQLHFCDYVVVKLTIHLPQNDYWQTRTGEFAGRIGVIQWNEYDNDRPPSDDNYLSELSLHILNGIAEDSCDVYVDGTLVYSYVDNTPPVDPELWQVHMIDLSPYAIICGTNTVKIDATGTQWGSFNTYGQLAIDEITLSCDNGNSATVDIGDTTSESGHNLVDWGPIEPATSSGNYGGIDDCRVTWFNGGSDTWATIDFNL